MIKSLNTAAKGIQAQQTNMDVIGNNIGNVSTTGFKKARAEFEDLLYYKEKEPGVAVDLNSVPSIGVQVPTEVKTAGINKDFVQESSTITKNAFDLEIEGSGFFPVQLPNGQIGYTRDGAFKKGLDGQLITQQGYALQPQVIIPSNAIGVEFSPQGQVSLITKFNAVAQVTGQIQLVNFINPAGLKSIGSNVFIPTGASGLPQQGIPGDNGIGTITQGQLETRNINIVGKMVNMITAQRV